VEKKKCFRVRERTESITQLLTDYISASNKFYKYHEVLKSSEKSINVATYDFNDKKIISLENGDLLNHNTYAA
jgi:hypothetical protein